MLSWRPILEPERPALPKPLPFPSGLIPTMGSIQQGNTIGDFEPEEVHRHHSLSTALLQFEWKGTQFNVLDTPGMVDYGVEVQSALRAADGVILVVGAGTGLRSEIERVWGYIQDHELPCLLFINELDKDGSDLHRVLGECEKTLELKGVPLTIPAIDDEQLTGVIDLLSCQLVASNTQSLKTQRTDIPPEYEGLSKEARRHLTELVAETNDQFVEKYLTDGELSDEDLIDGLTLGTLGRKIVPVLCGSATENIGIASLLEAVTRFLPSPEDRASLHPWEGTHPQMDEGLSAPTRSSGHSRAWPLRRPLIHLWVASPISESCQGRCKPILLFSMLHDRSGKKGGIFSFRSERSINNSSKPLPVILWRSPSSKIRKRAIRFVMKNIPSSIQA